MLLGAARQRDENRAGRLRLAQPLRYMTVALRFSC